MKNFIKYFIFITVILAASCSKNSDQEPKFYSKETPGKWDAQKETHIPVIEYDEGLSQVKVSVPVTPNPGHYIEVILLTDKNHKELAKKALGRSQLAEATFEVPLGYHGKLFVVSKCNLHDMWEAELKIK
ncbi:MAG: desulfoferrodoxin family protein [Spirochaetia bacterium]|nr:desulfoferrodoxin family protein [Spirochaetia bacterium]